MRTEARVDLELSGDSGHTELVGEFPKANRSCGRGLRMHRLGHDKSMDTPALTIRQRIAAEGVHTAPMPDDPSSGADDEIAQRRYADLIRELGDELRGVRGWKRMVAEKLSISPAHLSRVLHGKKRAGLEAMEAAADRLGFDVAYFFDTSSGKRSYREFMEPEPVDMLGEAEATVIQVPGQFARAVRDAQRIALALQKGESPDQSDVHSLAGFVLSLPMVKAAEAVSSLGLEDYAYATWAAMMAQDFLSVWGAGRRLKEVPWPKRTRHTAGPTTVDGEWITYPPDEPGGEPIAERYPPEGHGRRDSKGKPRRADDDES